MSSPKFSPFDYFLGRFIDAFSIEDSDAGNDSKDASGLDSNVNDAWEVSVIVHAHCPCDAYDKVIEIAERDNKRYEGELGGLDVNWTLIGLTELEPIMADPGTHDDFMYIQHRPVCSAEFVADVQTRKELCGEAG